MRNTFHPCGCAGGRNLTASAFGAALYRRLRRCVPLQKSENRLAELDKLFKRIYEDMVNGKLSEARFQMLSDDYEQEQEELRAKIEMLENEIQNQEDQAENVDRFIRVAKKHLYLEKLTPDVLNDMVQAVYVHAPDNSSGQRIQDVDISYNYIGILPANLLYDIINGKAA